jgi:hypothetical protein
MQNIVVPNDFLVLAKTYGLNQSDATELYERRHARNVNCKDLAWRLAGSKQFDSERSAQMALNGLWMEYTKTSVVDSQPVNAMAQARVTPLVRTKPESYLGQAREALARLIGPFQGTAVPRTQKPACKGEKVAGGDIHGLFADPQAFAAFCADPAEEAILVGDFMDLYAASRYRATIDHITIREELADARAKAELLSASFKRVYYIDGNHDRRALKKMQDVVPQLLPLMISPMRLITADLPNFVPLNLTVPNTSPNTRQFAEDYVMDYAGMVGDVLVGHFENFCGVEAPAAVENWINKWDHVLKLPVSPRLILQGHNHRLNMQFTPKGRCLVSTGCLCRPMPYQIDGHGKYEPPVPGYVRFKQNAAGVTDLNSLQYITLGGE